MKVGIVGLGSIALKAYLPVITARENIELVLCTRNDILLNEISNRYRIQSCTQTIDELLDYGIDAAFVHTATEAHTEIVEKLLLNGINVYVDKPISYNYENSLSLSNLAQKNRKILMVGFNRRFAPMYKALKSEGKADIIIMQKNRVSLPDAPRTFIYDDFIHVVDTLRFLMDTPIEDIRVNFLQRNGKLYNVALQLSGEKCTAIGIMNRDSGTVEERLEYMSSGKKYIVNDLTSTIAMTDSSEKTLKFNDWDSTLKKRGFEQIIDHFINSVERNMTPDPSIYDSLITHEICEKIVSIIIKSQ